MPARWPTSEMEVSHKPRWPTVSLSVSSAKAAGPVATAAVVSTKASARASLVMAVSPCGLARTSLRLIRISGHCGAPPRFLQSERNFLRALPCRPLASACCEHALETASLLVGSGVPDGGGVCADAPAIVTAKAIDRMAAQDATGRMTPPP